MPLPSVGGMTENPHSSTTSAPREPHAAPHAGESPRYRPRPGALGRLAALAYLWVVLVVLGAIVLETVMVYPNVFADPPDSLALTMDFFAVTGPSDVFPPLGFSAWVLGAAAVILCRRQKDARWWLLASLLAILGEGVASVLFFWPRNEILFVEGLAEHTSEYLAQVAREFETWHWRSRMGFNVVAAVAAFVGYLRTYRAGVLDAAPVLLRATTP